MVSVERTRTRSWPFGAAVVLAAFAVSCTGPAPGPEPGRVELSELVYHSSGDDDDHEFIELHNAGGSPVDLGEWCFVEGIEGCFSPGVTLEPGGHTVLAADAVAYSTVYGRTAHGTFEGGKLSNGGEQLVLVDATGKVALDCTYSDDPPWPTTPDGGGASLERSDFDADCNDPAAWIGSLDPAGATPGEANSNSNPDLPQISSVEIASSPEPGRPVPILVRADRATAVSVAARVDFGDPVIVELADDGGHGDGEAGDGLWGGQLPAVPADGLLRYRTTAWSSSGFPITDPPTADGMEYRGVVAEAASGQSPDLPLLRWYMDPADYDAMVTAHLTDDRDFAAVVAIGDRVYDNARVAVKGTSSVFLPKKKFAFDLPDGYLLDVPWLEHGIDEFDLQANMDFDPIDEQPAWRTFEHFGVPTVQNHFVRVHRNTGSSSAEFQGTYLLREDYDGKWRDREGFEDGTFFKHAQDNKTDPDAGPALADEFIFNATTRTGDDLRNYLLDHLDVPAYINFMAVAAVTQYDHWGWYFNVNQFVDGRTGRWEYLPLDLDATYDDALNGEPGFDRLVDPSYDPHLYEPAPYESRFLESAVFQFSEFREMYFRRLVSVHDEMEASDLPGTWYDEAFESGAQSFAHDHTTWVDGLASVLQAQYDVFFDDGQPPPDYAVPWYFSAQPSVPADLSSRAVAAWWSPTIARSLFHLNQSEFDAAIASFQTARLLPGSQSGGSTLGLSLATSVAGDPDGAHVVLHNPGEQAVDVSAWALSGGANAMLPNGSVIPAGSCAVVPVADRSLRQLLGSGHLVLTELDGAPSPELAIGLTRSDGTPVPLVAAACGQT
jgi:hypothetical protein